ncbi:Gp138 family membrane-puncturing spike protein [uncultured Desulfovibrio sp.]|uniref:Gp138 family membrane-puncturing spike protein n=1 Tax=uncultured Desulfovibrio sp. TaxID=167968 RepID=UPI00262D9CFE|nr:Gp138 family membrane-puncturing spike protein [uncultured Desulfovibrio sp.]
MDRSERQNDPIESQRLAQEGHQAQMWTALPGLVTAFDPAAMTVSVQPAVQGSVKDESGKSQNVQMPLLVDVPVVFVCGGGFSLTYPVKPGDEALVVFASRCIDGWWQDGQAAPPPDSRMHDLSDGMAIVGPRSQATKLHPPVDPENVQLRTDDGRATVTMKPDYTIESKNPDGSITIAPGGAITAEATATILIKAPQITLEGNVTTTGAGGGPGTISMKGDISLEGSLTSTGDQVAEGKSTAHHSHTGDSGGTTGEPL